MPTRVYGCGDDLIEFEGDLRGEIEKYNTDEDGPITVIFSDGTEINVQYCMKVSEVWGICVLKKGRLFESHKECTDPDGDPYSDEVFFKDGKLSARWGQLQEVN